MRTWAVGENVEIESGRPAAEDMVEVVQGEMGVERRHLRFIETDLVGFCIKQMCETNSHRCTFVIAVGFFSSEVTRYAACFFLPG